MTQLTAARRAVHAAGLLAAIFAALVPAVAQQRTPEAPRALTKEDYARAERFMTYNTTPLVFRTGVRPVWLRRRPVLVSRDDGGRQRVGAGRSRERDQEPLRVAGLPRNPTTRGRHWARWGRFRDCQHGAVARRQARRVHSRPQPLGSRRSPPVRKRQLTTDGVKDFGYATDNAGWTKSDRPILRLVAGLEAGRHVPARSAQRRRDVPRRARRSATPSCRRGSIPLPGDERHHHDPAVVIDVDAAKVVTAADGAGSSTAPRCATTSRAAAASGRTCSGVRTAHSSRSCPPRATTSVRRSASRMRPPARSRRARGDGRHASSNPGNGRVNWRVLPGSNEVIWFSERDNWGQLYLYDLASGKAEAADHLRRGQRHAAAAHRREGAHAVLHRRSGREQGRDPYFTHLYRIGMDGEAAALLTPEDANHEMTLSDSGRYFVDSYSRPTSRRWPCCATSTASCSCTLEKADVSTPARDRLEAADAVHRQGARRRDRPVRAHVHARPTSTRQGSIRSSTSIYPGPQSGSVGTPQLRRRARRRAGARRARLHRRVRSTGWGRRGRSK